MSKIVSWADAENTGQFSVSNAEASNEVELNDQEVAGVEQSFNQTDEEIAIEDDSLQQGEDESQASIISEVHDDAQQVPNNTQQMSYQDQIADAIDDLSRHEDGEIYLNQDACEHIRFMIKHAEHYEQLDYYALEQRAFQIQSITTKAGYSDIGNLITEFRQKHLDSLEAK